MDLFADLPDEAATPPGVPRITVRPERTVPAAGRALLDAIAGSESPDYSTIYGGRKFQDFADHPRQAVPIRTGPNAGNVSTAAGRYQFLARTWDEVAKEAGLPDFSPDNQDLGAWHLANKTYQQRTGRDLEKDLTAAQGNPNAVKGIARYLSGVWTSLPGGIEPNRATSSFADRYTAGSGGGSVRATPPNAPDAVAGLFADLPDDTSGQPATFRQRFGGGIPSKDADKLSEGLRRRADLEVADETPGGQVKTFIEQFANTAMLNIPRNVDAYFKSRETGRPFNETYEDIKAEEEAGSRLNRKSSIAGTLTGIGAGAVALPGIGGGVTTAARVGRAALTGAGYSAAAEAFDSKDPLHTAIAATLGGALGGVSAPIAEKITGLVSGLVRRGRTAETFLDASGNLTPEAVAAAKAAGIDPATFGAVLNRKLAEGFAEKGAGPSTAREAAASEFNIPLSRGQSTRDLEQIRYENMASRGAYGKPAQDTADAFFTSQNQAIRGAGADIGERVAGTHPVAGTPGEAGAMLNEEVGRAATRARSLTEGAEAHAASEATAARGNVQDQANALGDIIGGGRAPLSRVQDAGEVVGEGVRGRAAQARGEFRGLYNEAFSHPGELDAAGVRQMGTRIRERLSSGDTPLIVDDVTTPMATRALNDLNDISNLRIQNRADPNLTARGAPANPDDSVVAVDLRGIDQARKRLVAYYKAARGNNNPSDARAVGQVIDGFDDHVERAITNGLFSGDPAALEALRAARASYSRYQRDFRPQGAGDDVGNAMRKITDRNATPEEIANMVLGNARTGATGLSVRLADRLRDTLGANSEAWTAVRQAAWQKVSEVRNAAGEIDSAKSAAAINDFLNGSGQSLARRLFTAEEQAAMRSHASAVRNLEATIESSTAARGAEQARSLYQEAFGGAGIGGPPGQVFNKIVSGQATPEETASAVFHVLSGNPGNATRMIDAVEKIVGRDSPAMAAIRQGVFQRLTTKAEGMDQPGAQKIAQNLNDFLNGNGKTIAARLYTPEERATIQRFAQAVKMTVVPPGARTNSDTAVALGAMMQKMGSAVLGTLGVADSGLTGGVAGYAVSQLLKGGLAKRGEAKAAAKARGAFEQGAPVMPPAPPPGAAQAGRASGLIGGQLF